MFAEFQDKGLLFIWEHEGKRYAHWTGSDVPGRLPPPSWRMRLEKFAPPVPKQRLAEYMAGFARGRAGLAGAEFRGEPAGQGENCRSQISDFKETRGNGRRQEDLKFENSELTFENSDLKNQREHSSRRSGLKFENSELGEKLGSGARAGHLPLEKMQTCGSSGAGAGKDCRDGGIAGLSGIKDGVEETQAQDWNLNLDWKLKEKWELGRDEERQRSQGANREKDFEETGICNSNSQPIATARSSAPPKSNANSHFNGNSNATSNANALNRENLNSNANSKAQASSDSQLHSNACANLNSQEYSNARAGRETFPGATRYARSEKELALARELRVGEGPVCGPFGVRREAIERARQREEAWAKAGKRAP